MGHELLSLFETHSDKCLKQKSASLKMCEAKMCLVGECCSRRGTAMLCTTLAREVCACKYFVVSYSSLQILQILLQILACGWQTNSQLYLFLSFLSISAQILSSIALPCFVDIPQLCSYSPFLQKHRQLVSN